MHTEASIAPGNGHGAETPSSTHWLEDVIPSDATYDSDGRSLPLREHPALTKYGNATDLAKAFVHSQNLVGKKTVGLTALAEDATDQERLEFHSELRRVLGVPDGPDGYEITMPEGMEADATLLPWFKQSAHELGMSPAQAQGLSDRYNQLARDLEADSRNRLKSQQEEAMGQLRGFWGTQAEGNAEIARRGFKDVAARAGIPAEEAEAILGIYGHHPTMLRIFHEVGKTKTEDGFVRGSGGPRGGGEPMTMEQFFAEKVFGGKKE